MKYSSEFLCEKVYVEIYMLYPSFCITKEGYKYINMTAQKTNTVTLYCIDKIDNNSCVIYFVLFHLEK